MGRRGGHGGGLSSYVQLASSTEALPQSATMARERSAIRPLESFRKHRAALTQRSQRSLSLLERSRRVSPPHWRSSRISSRRLLVLSVVHGLMRVLLRWSATLRRLAHLPVHIAITGLLLIPPAGVLLVVIRVIPLLVASLIVCVLIVLLMLLTSVTCGRPSLLRASLITILLLSRLLIAVVLLLVCHGVFAASEQPPAGC